MIIRQEKPSEFQAIHDLVRDAFQTAKISNGKEQEYVTGLRGSEGYIPELALVAEIDGNIVGHIMLTKTYIATHDSKFEALLLAPLSISLNYRTRGIGSSLIARSFRLAKRLGYKAVFVVGDPAYYCRFGFKPSKVFNIRHVPPIPEENVMALELSSAALQGVSGTVTFT